MLSHIINEFNLLAKAHANQTIINNTYLIFDTLKLFIEKISFLYKFLIFK